MARTNATRNSYPIINKRSDSNISESTCFIYIFTFENFLVCTFCVYFVCPDFNRMFRSRSNRNVLQCLQELKSIYFSSLVFLKKPFNGINWSRLGYFLVYNMFPFATTSSHGSTLQAQVMHICENMRRFRISICLFILIDLCLTQLNIICPCLIGKIQLQD